MKMAENANIRGIEFEIKGSSDAATKALDDLASTLKKLKSVVGGGLGLSSVSVELKTLNEASKQAAGSAKLISDNAKASSNSGKKSVKETTQEIRRQSTALRDLNSTLKNVRSVWTDIPKLSKASADGFSVGDINDRLKSFSPGKYIAASVLQPITQALAMVEEQFDKSGVTAGGFFDSIIKHEQLATDNMTPFLQVLEFLKRMLGQGTQIVFDFAKALGKLSLKGIKGLGTIFTKPFTKGFHDIKGFATGIGKVVGSFKRILRYRIIRSVIREVSQAFGEGIKNLYGWSTMVGGKFAASMNQITTALTYFKNSVGAAVAPIINALAPAIDFLIDKVVALINVINQLFARLTGASSWTKAIKKATDYEDAIGGAGGAAKEALKYLAPFDELNVLPSDKGGGGGSSSGADYSGMFEEMESFSDGVSTFADKLKEAFSSGDWEGLGTLLGDKINELAEKIDFAGIGAKIGEYINGLFTTKYWTLKETNFTKIGADIATFLNNMLGGIDFDVIGRTVAQKFTVLGDLIIGFLEETDWSIVGKSIGNYIKGSLDELSEWIDEIDWGETLSAVVTGLIDFIAGLDLTGIIGSLLGAAKKILNGLIEGIVGLLTDEKTWKLVWAWLQDLPLKLAQIGIDIINALVDPIVTGMNEVIGAINDTFDLDIKPIEFQLIPDIPKEELTKHYDEAKREIESLSVDRPVVLGSKVESNSTYQELAAQIEADSKRQPINVALRVNGNDPSELGKTISDSIESGTSGKTFTTNVIGSLSKLKDDLSDIDRNVKATAIVEKTKFELSEQQRNMRTNALIQKTDYSGLKESSRNMRTNAIVQKADYSDLTEAARTFSSIARINKFDALPKLKDVNGNLVVDAKLNVTGQSGTPTINAKINPVQNAVAAATGGAFYGGFWHSIPQYANGTTNAYGSLFVAGEAGPELVGHVGGRTEVLNRSQLAATMYAAVRNAMSGIGISMTIPNYDGSDAGDSGASEDAVYRAFRRALSEVEIDGEADFDSDSLYFRMVQKNRQNTIISGVNALATV